MSIYMRIYFYSFGVEDISKEIKKFLRNKYIKTNIYRIQAHELMKCEKRFYCIYWFYVKR